MGWRRVGQPKTEHTLKIWGTIRAKRLEESSSTQYGAHLEDVGDHNGLEESWLTQYGAHLEDVGDYKGLEENW